MGNSKTVRYVFSAVVLTIAILFLLLLATHNYVFGQTTPTALDPGVRVGGRLTGTPLATLTPAQVLYFEDGLNRFLSVDSVTGTAPAEPNSGLGPAYNSNSCGSCHAQPAPGGSSPVSNPQFDAAFDDGATNTLPSFIAQDGPVREARFPLRMNAAGTAATSIGDGFLLVTFVLSHGILGSPFSGSHRCKGWALDTQSPTVKS
jgi:Di-haem oxidoreductase, putative peroxidase